MVFKAGTSKMNWREGEHYIATSTEYYCLKCCEYFPKTYQVKRQQLKGKICGTAQLMALWAWYNFERHLKKCLGQELPV